MMESYPYKIILSSITYKLRVFYISKLDTLTDLSRYPFLRHLLHYLMRAIQKCLQHWYSVRLLILIIVHSTVHVYKREEKSFYQTLLSKFIQVNYTAIKTGDIFASL